MDDLVTSLYRVSIIDLVLDTCASQAIPRLVPMSTNGFSAGLCFCYLDRGRIGISHLTSAGKASLSKITLCIRSYIGYNKCGNNMACFRLYYQKTQNMTTIHMKSREKPHFISFVLNLNNSMSFTSGLFNMFRAFRKLFQLKSVRLPTFSLYFFRMYTSYL